VLEPHDAITKSHVTANIGKTFIAIGLFVDLRYEKLCQTIFHGMCWQTPGGSPVTGAQAVGYASEKFFPVLRKRTCEAVAESKNI
jgi:hypothetical protein